MENQLKRDYPDIIQKTVHVVPENYEQINFEQFLFRTLSLDDEFIRSETIGKLRERLMSRFGNYDSCFKMRGRLTEVKFTDLRYYQSEVGISGPKFSKLDDPIFVLKVDNNLILWNGYHRTLVHINAGLETSHGLLLEI